MLILFYSWKSEILGQLYSSNIIKAKEDRTSHRNGSKISHIGEKREWYIYGRKIRLPHLIFSWRFLKDQILKSN